MATLGFYLAIAVAARRTPPRLRRSPSCGLLGTGDYGTVYKLPSNGHVKFSTAFVGDADGAAPMVARLAQSEAIPGDQYGTIIAPAGQAALAAAATTCSIVTTPPGGTVTITRGVLSNGSPLPLSVSSTYTASGAINPSDTYALLNCATPAMMTLANSSSDGSRLTVTNMGPASATLTMNYYGAIQTVTLNKQGIVNFVWNAAHSTYLLAS